MGVRKHSHTDSPDWELLRDEVESAVDAYCEWLRIAARGSHHETSPLLSQVGEALIALSEHLGISVHIYGREVVTPAITKAQ
jgi:hypothetical protein